GDVLATGADDGTLRLWRASDGKLLWKRQVFNGQVFQIRFSPDGSLIASCRLNRGAAFVDTASGQLFAQPISTEVNGIGWAGTAAQVLTSDRHGATRLWSLEGTPNAFQIPLIDKVQATAVSGDRKVLAAIDPAGLCAVLRATNDRGFETRVIESFQI